MVYIVIIAGGKGERFWPKSVRNKPKQFHKIISDKTMIQETFFRVYPEFKRENIFVVLGENLKTLLMEQLPTIDKRNLVVEPIGKNTAPAIGLAAIYIYKIDPDAVITILTADHVVEPEREFLISLNTAVKVAEMGYLVTFGITPDRPATEYGYIEIDERIHGSFDLDVFHVKKFTEKPLLKLAQRFVKAGTFLWNSGMFAFRVKDILESMKRYMPSLFTGLMNISNSIGMEDEEFVKKDVFEKLDSISIDYGIMEKADNIACIKPGFLWDDIGSWRSLDRHRKKDKDGNIVEGEAVIIDSKNNIVLGEGNCIISLIGVNDIVVVKEGDKLLLCRKTEDQKIKEALKVMSKDDKYLKYL